MPDNEGDQGEGHVGLFDAPADDAGESSTDTTSSTSEIDWESDDNPYKERAKGQQREASKLREQVSGQAGSVEALARIERSIGAINSRIDEVQDLAAEAADLSETIDYDPDDPDSQSQTPTSARRDKARQQRQTRETGEAAAKHNILVQDIAEKIKTIYTQGMVDDPEVKEAAAKFQAAVTDPSKGLDLYEALETMRTVSQRFAESEETSDDSDTDEQSSESDSSQDSEDDSDSETDDEEDEEVEDKPTKREALITSASTSGQSTNGISPGVDDSNMSALDMFEQHLQGKKPAGT
jgi:uncharacterized protein YoxC